MANPSALAEGSAGLKLPLLVGPDGTVYLQAAGDSIAVTGATSPSAPILTQSARASAGTRTSVAGADADTLLIAANPLRKGATIYNDSSAVLYLGLGATAVSTTDYTIQLVAGASGFVLGAYYEVPENFAGQVRGYWASAAGDARVTELT